MPDLQALDALTGRLGSNAKLFVLDIDSCKTESDLGKLMPGSSVVMQSPVVAEYRDGRLQFFDQGEAAVIRVREWSKDR